MTEFFIEIAGWVGAVCVLGAYVLLSIGRLSSSSVLFHLLNIIGAIGFVINTWWHGAIPSMVLNIVWCGVGLYALAQIFRKARGPA